MANRALVYCPDAGVPLLGPSGASAHLRGVVAGLGAAGFIPHVAVPRLHDARGRAVQQVEASVTTREPTPRAWLGRAREVGQLWHSRRLLDDALAALGGQPDVLWERHSLFADGGLRSGIAPRLVELNAPLSLERARYDRVRWPWLASRTERRSLQSADRVVAVSAWLAEWAVSEAGCAPQRVVHLPNGSAIEGPGDRQGFRSEHRLEGLVLGFVGSLKPWHGLHLLSELAEAMPDATIMVAGDGPGQVPQHARIRALGRVAPDALPDLLAACDVGLAPYVADSPPWFCPLKVLDYRAAGLPVVASDVGDCRALIGEAGVVTGPGVDAWMAAIHRVAGSTRVPAPRSWAQVVHEGLAGLV